jgi:hypothetical protein
VRRNYEKRKKEKVIETKFTLIIMHIEKSSVQVKEYNNRIT